MKYIAIWENGFIVKFNADTQDEADFNYDQMAIPEDGTGIYMTEKLAKRVARNILTRKV